MSEKKNWPCKLTPTGLEQCWALDEVLEDDYGRGTKQQGLKLQTLMNMDSFDFSRHLVTLKSGKHGKKGLVLNLCPFCGEELVAGASKGLRKRRKAASSPLSRPEHS